MRDEHCHILWGVDDGSKSWEQTVAMLDAAVKAGVTSMVCTPHMRWSDFDQKLVEGRFAQFKDVAAERGIAVELGYEVFYNRIMELGLAQAPCFVRQGSRDFLFEFNTGAPVEQGWDSTVYALQSQFGLKVTIAHPERYTSVLDDYDMVHRLKEAGCRIQVSAGDLVGGLFDKRAKCAKWIMREGLCDALVSDAHCAEHYDTYARMVSKWL